MHSLKKISSVTLFGVLALFCSIGTFSSSVFADTLSGTTLEYVVKANDSAFRFYLGDTTFSGFLYKFRLNGTALNMNGLSTSQNNLQLNSFNKIAGEISVERSSIPTGSGSSGSYTVDSTTSGIKVRRGDTVYLKGTASLSSLSDSRNIYTLPLNRDISKDLNEYGEIKKSFQISVNGTDSTLESGSGSYADGKYYIINDTQVAFLAKNLPERINKLVLKVDGIPSNYVIINKEHYTFGEVNRVEFTEENTLPILRVYIDAPSNVPNLSTTSTYVNGQKIDSSNALVASGKVVIKIDLSKTVTTDNVLSIYLKNENENLYSNTKVIDISDYSKFTINKVEFSGPQSSNFEVKLYGNQAGFWGDVSKLKVNINGVDYTQDGEKVARKNTDGTATLDSDKNPVYDYIRRLFIRRTGYGIAFDSFATSFTGGVNKIYLTNGNTTRTSNTVEIMRNSSGFGNINYNLTSSGTLAENITFEKVSDWSKNNNFITNPLTDLGIGKISFNNLGDSSVYELGFQIKTDTKINPFSELKLETLHLSYETDANGYITYNYKNSGIGKTIGKGGNLIFNLNGLFNIENPMNLEIKNVYIKKFTSSSDTGTSVFTRDSLGKMYLRYTYDFGDCFDGTTDYCQANGKKDPSLQVSFSSDLSKVNQSVTEIKGNTPSTSATGVTTGKVTVPTIQTPNIRTPNIRTPNIPKSKVVKKVIKRILPKKVIKKTVILKKVKTLKK